MNWLRSMKVSTRNLLWGGLTAIGLLLFCTVSLVSIHDNMLEDRKQRIKSLVEAGIGVLGHYHQLSTTGKLTDKDAKTAALDALRYMRYEGGNYLFGFDPEGNYYLSPASPDFEGTNKIDLKDANGKYLIRELISVAKAGGGYVAYDFPKPGTQTASPKIGHAVLFAPWNLVIGTGIYIDDVDVVFRRVLIQLVSISLALLAVLTAMGWAISRSISGPLNTVVDVSGRMAAGDFDFKLDTTGRDEAGAVFRAVMMVKEAVHAMIGDAGALSTAAANGRLETRVDAARHQGEYRNIIEGLNRTMDAVVDPINDVKRVMAAVEQGDLGQSIDAHYQGDFGALQTSVNNTLAKLSATIAQVNTSAGELSNASTQVSATSQLLSQATSEQAASLEQTTAAMEQMSASIAQNTDNAKTTDSDRAPIGGRRAGWRRSGSFDGRGDEIDRRQDLDHRRHCLPHRSAGAECGDRSGTSRRTRQGFCRRRGRGQETRRTQSDRRTGDWRTGEQQRRNRRTCRQPVRDHAAVDSQDR
jgi:methyl-accepting chemotaxis protein